MRKTWLLFKDSVECAMSNTVTILAMIGLIVIPSIFSWYNILACWNVFDNTGNLKVAVANADEGYKSDLLPIEVNMGDQVVSALRANDQLQWVITDENDAIDGTRAGRYYAAVVIPGSFSRDMMTFTSGDVSHVELTYYTNEKKNAIAPKVTDQGADGVANQVNRVFAGVLGEIALSVSSSLLDYAAESDVDGRIGQLARHVERLGEIMGQSATALGEYASVMDSARSIVGSSGRLLAQARDKADDVASTVQNVGSAADSAVETVGKASGEVVEKAAAAAAKLDEVEDAAQAALDDAALASDEARQLILQAAEKMDDEGAADSAKALREAANQLEEAGEESAAMREEALQMVAQARSDLAAAHGELDEGLVEAVESLAAVLTRADAVLADATAGLKAVGDELAGASGTMESNLAGARDELWASQKKLESSSAKLGELGSRIEAALEGDDLDLLRDIVGGDASQKAAALSAPVVLERHAVYPVENFGSAMAPLYTTLALWIGALVMMVTLRIVPSQRALEAAGNPSPRQVFLGRFGLVAVLSLLQSTCVSVGNMLFLGVQVSNPFLYLVCFWVSGLCFAFMIYTLVALFANLGKAISVLLLIVQVSGGGGSFPLQLLPQFFQDISPYLPITHAVNAMRAAMFGVYQGDFWIEIGKLVLFALPFLLFGLVLNGLLGKIVPRFVEKVESTKVM